MNITWMAIHGVTGYYIYQSFGGNSVPTRLGPLIKETSYEGDSRLTYSISAVISNADGTSITEGERSEAVRATVEDAPAMPTNLVATAANGSVSLTWMAPTSGAAVASYRVYRAVGNSGTFARLTTIPETLPSTTRTYTDSSAANGTEYTYTVRAVNADGIESVNSNTDSATPRAPAGAPNSLAAAVVAGRVTLTWTPPTGGGTVSSYRIYRAVGGGAFNLLVTLPSATRMYPDSAVTNGTTYRYVVRAVNESDEESADSEIATALPLMPPNAPTGLTATSRDGGVVLNWAAPASGGPVSQYHIYRATGNSISGATRLMNTNPAVIPATTTTYTDSTVTSSTQYTYAVRSVNVNGVESAYSGIASVQIASSIDRDNDMLIDIRNLDMLNNIRHNLAGTSYKSSDSDSGMRCGLDGTTDCAGYELLRDLDFDVAGDYASGSINMDWRPTGGTPGSATNSGWEPIGSNPASFTTLFEGNGRSISNFYSRNAANTNDSRFGLFGQLSTTGVLRNLLIEDSNVYGGSSRDHTGIAVGVNFGTIVNVAVRGGSVHAGDGNDESGGLAGYSSNTIIASSASTVAVYGDGATDNVGGLVGLVAGGSVTASYATGTVDGGTGDDDHVGGLVGRNSGTIRASYATGNINAHDGDNEEAGGLVGLQDATGTGTSIASYATGNIDGGAGTNDDVGKLIGLNAGGTITASYGFGTTSGGEGGGNNGTTLPSGVTTASQLTAPGSAAATAVSAEWQDAANHTAQAWDFGTATQTPALRYDDYDGNGGTDYCALFSARVPGTTDALTCGATFLPGQDRDAASLSPFDLTVPSIDVDSTAVVGIPFTLTATIRNASGARPAPTATLTYYRSTDNMRSPATDSAIGTDAVPSIRAGTINTQDIMLTSTTSVTSYYYVCVSASTAETDTTNNCSAVSAVQFIFSVDLDNDRLIDIQNLDMLNNIRYNLAGTSYKTGAGGSGIRCGADRMTDCIGYELLRDLDFAVAGSYADGTVNMAWRPTAGGSVVAPDSATNSGWQPIGANPASFNTRFEGHGRSISNLYIRNAANTADSRFGLFGQLSGTASIRNLLIEDGNVYGGSARDHVGIAVGVNFGTISNVIVSGGSAHGGNGKDEVGGLAGFSNNTIFASSASNTDVSGNEGASDNVGGLVGIVAGGTVTASYASGAVDGGTGDTDSVGGLVGWNNGTIRASYARGDANAGHGQSEEAGGLIGHNTADGAVIASYATGDADGGGGTNTHIGLLIGSNWNPSSSSVVASYGFGISRNIDTSVNIENPPSDGSVKPSAVRTPNQFTAPGTAAATAAPASWNQAASSTLGAWDFGTDVQLPALRYADYDTAGGGFDYCDAFSAHIPGTRTTLNCGVTLLPDQTTLRMAPAPDLTVSLDIDDNIVINAPFTITATVRNARSARSSESTTLTYYRSVDNMIDDGDTSIGTDTIPMISGAASATVDEQVTAPDTAGTYYYYACVDDISGEANTTNNCSSVASVTARIAPDLTAFSPEFSSASIGTGDTTTFSATVTNRMNGASVSDVVLTYYRSADSTLDAMDDEAIGTDTIPLLRGSSVSGRREITVTAPATAGTYYYYACATSVPNEADTTNNCSNGVMLTVNGVPDFAISNPSLASRTLTVNATTTFSVTVRNIGTIATPATPATTLTYYRSADTTVDTTNDTSIGTDTIATLAIDATSMQDVTITAPATAGTYYYYACVGRVTSTTIDERETDNNCSAVQSLVVGTTPDLVITNSMLSATTLRLGGATVFSVTVGNIGTAATTAMSTVTYYRSTDNITDTANDTIDGVDFITPLAVNATNTQTDMVTVLNTAGRYYYYVCVAAVSGENESNNCSTPIAVQVLPALAIVAAIPSPAASSVRISWNAASMSTNPVLTVSPTPTGFTAPSPSGNSFTIPITAAANTLNLNTAYTFTLTAMQLGDSVSATTPATTLASPVVLWSAGSLQGNFQFSRCQIELTRANPTLAVARALKGAGYTQASFVGSTDTSSFHSLRTDTAYNTRQILIAYEDGGAVRYRPITNGANQPPLTAAQALTPTIATSRLFTWANAGTREALRTLIGRNRFWSMSTISWTPGVTRGTIVYSSRSCSHATSTLSVASGSTSNATELVNWDSGGRLQACSVPAHVLCLAR